MIRNVVFDLGNVLITYKPYEYLISKGYDNEKANALLKAIFQDSLWTDLDKGLYEGAKHALDSFVEKTPELKSDIEEFFTGDWMNIYQVMTDTEELYNELINKGYNVYILSNFAKDGFAFIEERFEFISKASGKVISSHVKHIKPEPEIYDILLENFNLVPEETVFLDDLPCNIQAAKKAGIHGIVFTNLDEVKIQLEVLLDINNS